MFTATFIFVADKTDSVKINPHSEFLIFRLHLPAACAFLLQRLIIQRQSEYNVSTDFACVKLRVEPAQFDRMVAGEKAVQIAKMVAAAVVVRRAAAMIAGIPNLLDLLEGLGFLPVHLLYQVGVHLFAVADTLRFNLQRLVKQVVVACNDVDKVPDAPRRVVRPIQVYMDAATIICKALGLA